ncbi:MAG: VWA domain-containing protein [Symploca sp. SIO2E6]|nr:VWA domain-containing protein [Symploca sp. SIO2E6]
MNHENIDYLENIELFYDNPEPRCPVVLLLDTSASMSGERINQLNTGIATFKNEVEQDTTASLRVEVAIITFNNSVQEVQPFVTIQNLNPPQLTTSGVTAMGEAIELALDKVQSRRAIYAEYGISSYKPWVFLITDGLPTDEWQSAAQRVRQLIEAKKLTFFAVGVQGANMNILSKIAPAKRLDGLKFQELFRWLSDSMKRVSNSKPGMEPEQVSLPPTDGWDTSGWDYA